MHIVTMDRNREDLQYFGPTLSVLSLLKDLRPFSFYLTGSRFFGWANANSDIDFYTENSPEVKKILKDMGFEELPGGYETRSNYLKDNQTLSVMRHRTAKIDVQIVYDVEVKTEAQRILEQTIRVYPDFERGFRIKANAHVYWNRAYARALANIYRGTDEDL